MHIFSSLKLKAHIEKKVPLLNHSNQLKLVIMFLIAQSTYLYLIFNTEIPSVRFLVHFH
jgi:hypothetical protein